MTDNIVHLCVGDPTPDDILEDWMGEMETVILVGMDHKGALRVESSQKDALRAIGMLQAAIHGVMHVTEA